MEDVLKFVFEDPKQYLVIVIALLLWSIFQLITTIIKAATEVIGKNKYKIYEYFANQFRKKDIMNKVREKQEELEKLRKEKDETIYEMERLFKENEEIIEKFNINNCLNHRIFSFIDGFLRQTLDTLTTEKLLSQSHFSNEEKEKRAWNIKKLAEINLIVYEKHLRKFIHKIIEKNEELSIKSFENMLYLAYEEFVNSCDREGVNGMFLRVFYESHHENDKRNMLDCENIIQHYDKLSKSAKLNKILDIYYATIATNINNISVIAEINGRVSKALKDWEIPQ